MNTMHKTAEHAFELALALTATFLQINVVSNFQITDAILLKFAVFGGAATYVFKVMKDEKLNTRDGFFTALSGYTFGIYVAPALVEYFKLQGSIGYIGATHYLSGCFGMGAISVGWTILKGANEEAWPMVKDFFGRFLKKKDDGSNQP